MKTNASKLDYLHLHLIVWVWGFTAILGKLIVVPAVELVLLRTSLALVGIYAAAQYFKSNLALGKANILPLLGAGVIIALHWILFFASARISNVSICLAGIATASLWTSLLEPIMLGRKFKWHELWVGLLVILGLNIILFSDFLLGLFNLNNTFLTRQVAQVQNVELGLLVGVLSALCAAIFSILNAKFVRKHESMPIAFWEMAGAVISNLVFYIGWEFWFGYQEIMPRIPNSETWLYLGLLAFVCTVYPYIASVSLMRKFTPFSMNLIINLEPIYGILLARLIFGESEQMNLAFYAGFVVILASVLLFPFLDNRYYLKLQKRSIT